MPAVLCLGNVHCFTQLVQMVMQAPRSSKVMRRTHEIESHQYARAEETKKVTEIKNEAWDYV